MSRRRRKESQSSTPSLECGDSSPLSSHDEGLSSASPIVESGGDRVAVASSPHSTFKRSLKWCALGACLLALAVAAWLGAQSLATRWSLSYLPEPPDPASLPAARAEIIAEADAAAREAPGSAEAVAHLGRVYFANLDYDRAARCWTRAEQLDPGDWRWPYLRVLVMEERGEVASTVKTLENVVKLKPDHALAWYRLGMAEFKRGDDEAAQAALQRAIELDLQSRSHPADVTHQGYSVSAHARLQLGRVLLRKGEPQQAVDALAAALAEYPDFGVARRQLGQSYQAMGRELEASRELKRAANSLPFTPPVDPLFEEVVDLSRSSTFLLKQAALAKNAGRLARAEVLLKRARLYEPEDTEVLVSLADVIKDARGPKAALPYVAEALQSQPESANLLGTMATCLRAADGRAEAAKYYLRAMELDPNDVKVGNNYATFLLESGQAAAGEAVLRRYLQANPDSPQLLGNLGRLLLQKGRPQEAIIHLERAVEIRPENVLMRCDYAMGLSRIGQTEDAIRQFREALEYQPAEAGALAALVDLTMARQDYAQARGLSQRLVRLAPNDPRAHWRFAVAAARLGQKQEAENHCRTALNLAPDFKPAKSLLDELQQR